MPTGLRDDEIEIFSSGTHTSSNGVTATYTNDHLDAIARSYDPNLFDAPAVVGHPRDNSPAYAWVNSVRREGDKLVASLKDWDTHFQEAVKNKRYKKISASFYSPDSPSNPKPGSYYLRHVGFLGGMAPAVKGLKSVSFSEQEEGVVDYSYEEEVVLPPPIIPPPESSDFMQYHGWYSEVFRNLREWLIDQKDIETADRIVPAYLLNMPQDNSFSVLEDRVNRLEGAIAQLTSPDMESRLSQFGEQIVKLINTYEYKEDLPVDEENTETTDVVELTEQERRIQHLEEELRQSKLEKKRTAIASFVEGLKGKIRPTQKAELVEFMMNLPEDAVEFSEGRSQTHLVWMQSFLTKLPDMVSFKEVVPDQEIEEFSEEEKKYRNAYAEAAQAYAEAWRK